MQQHVRVPYSVRVLSCWLMGDFKPFSVGLPLCFTSQGAGGAAGKKETPQERLKRLMQAQLNKQQQKDHLTTAQKKVQVGMGYRVVMLGGMT